MLPDEYEQCRLRVAAALRALERALTDLVDALAHGDPTVIGPGASADQNLRSVCDAYATIDLPMDAAPNQSVVALAVVGASRHIVTLAENVNARKAELRSECAPLQRVRRRVPRREGGTEAIPVVRAILRSIQRSDLNLLSAYRKIPILGATPVSVSYTRAKTRAVYRKRVEEIGDMLQQNESPAAIRDRERLRGLRAKETHLALVRDHYENIRANVVYNGLDRRGKGRVMMSAELPILYYRKDGMPAPRVQFPDAAASDSKPGRKPRQSKIDPQPWLESLPVHRYLPT